MVVFGLIASKCKIGEVIRIQLSTVSYSKPAYAVDQPPAFGMVVHLCLSNEALKALCFQVASPSIRPCGTIPHLAKGIASNIWWFSRITFQSHVLDFPTFSSFDILSNKAKLKYPNIISRTNSLIWYKFDTKIYTDQFQNWLKFGHALLISYFGGIYASPNEAIF